MSRGTVFLEPVPPFRLDLTVWTLRRRPDNVVDRWDGTTYRRVLPLPTGPVDVAVTQVASPEAARLKVAVAGQPVSAAVRAAVTKALERLLGLWGGHALHGDMAPDQLLFMRPVRGYADYRTPIRGLYLCGAGTHPGGEVTGAPGHNAARAILADLLRDVAAGD